MRRIFANANYDFIGNRRKAYTASAIALAICFAAAIFNHFSIGSWVNYGVDFTGGSVIQVAVLDPDITLTDVRNLAVSTVPGAVVNVFGESGEFLIRTPGTASDVATESSDAMTLALREQFGTDNIRIEREESVGAKVGTELQGRALMAIVISFAAILIYLAWRFEWRFGVAAVVATLHDVLVTMGLIAILRLDVSLPTVAAVLTVLGYSLNDTIVIFDRIREHLHGGKITDAVDLMNRAINETLPRTVLTSATTLVTVVALFLFGGEIIRDFALILIVGIIVGSYSSVFIGAPVLLEIEKRFPREQKHVKRTRAPSTPRPSRV